jgi:hypothetical protein
MEYCAECGKGWWDCRCPVLTCDQVGKAFSAEIIRSIYPAADQGGENGGHDGGWCMATGPNPEDETWAETREELND